MAIGAGCSALIRHLDKHTAKSVVTGPADLNNPNQLAFDAGRRSIVDELVATQARMQNP